MRHSKTIYNGVIISVLLYLIAAIVGCGTMFGTAKPNPQLSAQYLEKGRQLETGGQLTEALEQYKLAVTADPQNEEAVKNSDRLTGELSRLADERYALGMKYHREGKYALARKQFLMALKYKPDHVGASRMLVSRQPEKTAGYMLHEIKPGETLSMIAKNYYGDYKKYDVIAAYNNITDVTMVRPGQTIKIPNLEGSLPSSTDVQPDLQHAGFVVHTVQPGQSISKLAQMYYGDYRQFHLIARFNKMDDATQVRAGDKIKIPRVAGLPFNPPAGRADLKPGTTTDTVATQRKSPPIAPLPEPAPEPIPAQAEAPSPLQPEEPIPAPVNGDEQVLAYRDAGIALYNKGRYEDAIFELNKAIEAMPQDAKTRSYLSKAYFESGKSLYDHKEFDSAQEAFQSALQFDPQCKECQGFLDKSRLAPYLPYREKGIEMYNRNDFDQAITAFNQYLLAQPGDNDTRVYLGKSYFQKALVDYNRGDFLAAKKGFEAALQFDSQCEKCASYIKQSLESDKESHYNKGATYYGQQQLENAIDEWQMVYDLDPQYKDVDRRLKKARDLKEKLEAIKKSRQQ